MARANSRRQQETIDLSLERGQVTTFVVGSVLALGAVFLLGVGYGRSLAEHPEGPAEDRTAAGVAAPEPEAPTLTFHDALTSARVEAEAAPAAPAAVTLKPAAAAQSPKSLPGSEDGEGEGAEARETRAEAAVDPAEDAPGPAAKKPDAAPAGDGFTVQVASSRERAHTDRLAEKLEAAGYDARVVPADIPGRGRWYRVRVGSYGSRDDAALAQADLKVALDLSGIIVAE